MSTQTDIPASLVAWGAWKRNYIEVDPAIKPDFFAITNSPATESAILAMDKLTDQLKEYRPDLYQWINARYKGGYSPLKLVKMTKVSKVKIDQYIAAGIAWMDCKLGCIRNSTLSATALSLPTGHKAVSVDFLRQLQAELWQTLEDEPILALGTLPGMIDTINALLEGENHV